MQKEHLQEIQRLWNEKFSELFIISNVIRDSHKQ